MFQERRFPPTKYVILTYWRCDLLQRVQLLTKKNMSLHSGQVKPHEGVSDFHSGNQSVALNTPLRFCSLKDPLGNCIINIYAFPLDTWTICRKTQAHNFPHAHYTTCQETSGGCDDNDLETVVK